MLRVPQFGQVMTLSSASGLISIPPSYALSRRLSVIVPVVRVRVMRMRVGEAIVPVAVGMTYAGRHRPGVGMAMVLVVLVLVRVLDGLVRMHVRVPLGEMQPHAPGHESRSEGEVPG